MLKHKFIKKYKPESKFPGEKECFTLPQNNLEEFLQEVYINRNSLS
jgi:hypothetical protein